MFRATNRRASLKIYGHRPSYAIGIVCNDTLLDYCGYRLRFLYLTVVVVSMKNVDTITLSLRCRIPILFTSIPLLLYSKKYLNCIDTTVHYTLLHDSLRYYIVTISN